MSTNDPTTELAYLRATLAEVRRGANAREVARLETELAEVTAERDEWRSLAQALRVQESRISGILCDASDVPVDPQPEAVAFLVKQRDEARERLRSRTLAVRGEAFRNDAGEMYQRVRATPPAGVPEVTDNDGDVVIDGKDFYRACDEECSAAVAQRLGAWFAAHWPARGEAPQGGPVVVACERCRSETTIHTATSTYACSRYWVRACARCFDTAESLAAAILSAGDAQCAEYREEIERLRGDFECAVKEGRRTEREVDRRIAEAVAREREECLVAAGDAADVVVRGLQDPYQGAFKVRNAMWEAIAARRVRSGNAPGGEPTTRCFVCGEATPFGEMAAHRCGANVQPAPQVEDEEEPDHLVNDHRPWCDQRHKHDGTPCNQNVRLRTQPATPAEERCADKTSGMTPAERKSDEQGISGAHAQRDGQGEGDGDRGSVRRAPDEAGAALSGVARDVDHAHEAGRGVVLREEGNGQRAWQQRVDAPAGRPGDTSAAPLGDVEEMVRIFERKPSTWRTALRAVIARARREAYEKCARVCDVALDDGRGVASVRGRIQALAAREGREGETKP